MLKIGQGSALLIVVCLAAVAQIHGDQFEQRGRSTVAGNILVTRERADSRTFSSFLPLQNRQAILYPDSTGAKPFGFIPTEWTTRPQLLPLTWDVRTVFASDGAGAANPGSWDFSRHVKTARVD